MSKAIKINCKGDIDMVNEMINSKNCVIEEWLKDVELKINEYFSKKDKDIVKGDIINNEIESFRKDLFELLKSNGIEHKDISVSVFENDNEDIWRNEIHYTHNTELALAENKRLHSQSISNLHKFCNEIHSVLSMCENFDNTVSVFRDYGVIESDSLKVNHDFDFMKFIKNDLGESKE